MEGYEIWLRLLSLGLGAALGLLPAQRALPRRLAGAPAAWALAAAAAALSSTCPSLENASSRTTRRMVGFLLSPGFASIR